MANADETELLAIEQEEHPGPSELDSALLRETLRNALSNRGLVLDEETSLAEVIRLMREQRQGCALVTRERRLYGIFTERDVLMKVVGTRIDLERTPVRSFATKNPVTLPAEASVAYALNRMLSDGFRHVPLVDENGCPAGVVSMRDIIEYLGGFFNKDVLNLPPEPIVSFSRREGA